MTTRGEQESNDYTEALSDVEGQWGGTEKGNKIQIALFKRLELSTQLLFIWIIPDACYWSANLWRDLRPVYIKRKPLRFSIHFNVKACLHQAFAFEFFNVKSICIHH